MTTSRDIAFRSYLITIAQQDVIGKLGRLSNRDWTGVQEALAKALQLS